MKRIAVLALCIAMLLVFAACGSGNSESGQKTGNYFMVGDYEELLAPYLWLDMREKTFALGESSIISYAEVGAFETEGNKLIATSQSTTYIFEIKNESTLVLIDNGADKGLVLPNNSEFVYSEKYR